MIDMPLQVISDELKNAVIDSGQSLDANDNFQISKAMAIYGSGGDYYNDTGSSNNYILNVVGSKKAPPAYFQGMRVRFRPSNTNTGSSTVNVAGLGVKSIKLHDGAKDVLAGDISKTYDTELVYDGTVFRINSKPKYGFVDVRQFGAVGDGVTDDTNAIQAALDTGKSVYFPEGVYLTDGHIIPSSSSGAIYFGDGFHHYDAQKKTVIKARTLNQNYIFKIEAGTNNICFRDMHIEGDEKAKKGIDGVTAFLTLENLGIYHCIEYGVYTTLGGVWRLYNVHSHGSDIGVQLYSDSSAMCCSFSGGRYPLKIVAGGNRLVNIWANTGTEACILLEPLDESTTHINTSITNLYAGETLGGAVSMPIIHIKGNAAQKVQQVQISNSHLVSAAGSPSGKINGGILIDYGKEIVLSNIAYMGNLNGEANLYTDYFVKATNTESLAVSGCILLGVNKNPIYLGASVEDVNITGNIFKDFCTRIAVGAEGAAIRSTDGAALCVSGCTFHITGVSTVPYAVDVNNAAHLSFSPDNVIRYPSSTIVTANSGTFSGGYRRFGSDKQVYTNVLITGPSLLESPSVNRARQNYLDSGTASTPSGGGTVDLFTLENVNEDQNYIITVQQSGSPLNAAVGKIFAYGGQAKVITTHNTNSAPLLLTFSNSGLTIKLTADTGYGPTTWRWAIMRIY